MKQSPRNSIWSRRGLACAGCRSHIAVQHMWDALSPPGTSSEEMGWAAGAPGLPGAAADATTQQLLPPRRGGDRGTGASSARHRQSQGTALPGCKSEQHTEKCTAT